MAPKLVIAIDGGAGTGTSSAAEGVAAALGIPHLNSGSLYRAVTWEVLRQGVDPHDEAACERIAKTIKIELENGIVDRVNGHEVKNELYGQEVSRTTPIVGGYSGVRREIVVIERAAVATHGAVVEGRTIGIEAFPDAQFKFYFTCNATERARRLAAGSRPHETVESLQARDAQDEAREHGRFVMAEGAIEIDTTHLSKQEVVDKVVRIIQSQVAKNA